MHKYLITGCAGFIGSHLIEYILKMDPEAKIIGIDNFDLFYNKEIKLKNMSNFTNHEKFEFLNIDITNYNQVLTIPKVDFVFHLAAKAGVRPSIESPNSYIKTNITGTQNLLLWMESVGIKKMVFASSSSIYGNNKKIPFEETDIVDFPISPYAFTKKSCELLNFTFHHLYKFSIINLRFFTVYGPRQRPDLAINKFITKLINYQPIDVYGDGSTSRDYTFIFDIIEGIIAAKNHINNLNTPVYEIINLGNNKPVKLIDLISTIEVALNTKAKINFHPLQDGDVNITYANIDKAKNLLGYKPKVDLATGILYYVNWKIKKDNA